MISIYRLHEEVQTISEEEFVARYPMPAFLVQPGKAVELKDEVGAKTQTVRLKKVRDAAGWLVKTYMDLGEELVEDRPVAPPRESDVDFKEMTHVVFVRKHPTNPSPFPNMITMGRMPNNDILLAFSAISKVHAVVFQGSQGEWYLSDQNSTNGTWLNQVRLGTGDKVRVEDGSWVNLGATLGLKFLLPHSLYGFLLNPNAPSPRPS